MKFGPVKGHGHGYKFYLYHLVYEAFKCDDYVKLC
jgi:hypothetical protein